MASIRDDSDDSGWWETSEGAAFGADRLAELEKLIADMAT